MGAVKDTNPFEGLARMKPKRRKENAQLGEASFEQQQIVVTTQGQHIGVKDDDDKKRGANLGLDVKTIETKRSSDTQKKGETQMVFINLMQTLDYPTPQTNPNTNEQVPRRVYGIDGKDWGIVESNRNFPQEY